MPRDPEYREVVRAATARVGARRPEPGPSPVRDGRQRYEAQMALAERPRRGVEEIGARVVRALAGPVPGGERR